MLAFRPVPLAAILLALAAATSAVPADGPPAGLKKAFVDGTGPGWVPLGGEDFTDVNGDKDTWGWKADGSARCTGTPVGVTRSQKAYTNFELVLEWMHEKPAGNSGVFVWTPKESLDALKRNQLPGGIEVQILDHGYKTNYEKDGKRKADWFTTNGDVFSVGKSKLKPFAPASKDGRRSFPRKETTLGHGNWNHYYIRAVNGEVRLWVNGEEVSGGSGADPRTGHLCLESEGSPIQFKNIRLRELP
ncbi:MAG: 3-keto-disaccharide hydrolase [Gemmataceae bacterium]